MRTIGQFDIGTSLRRLILHRTDNLEAIPISRQTRPTGRFFGLDGRRNKRRAVYQFTNR